MGNCGQADGCSQCTWRDSTVDLVLLLVIKKYGALCTGEKKSWCCVKKKMSLQNRFQIRPFPSVFFFFTSLLPFLVLLLILASMLCPWPTSLKPEVWARWLQQRVIKQQTASLKMDAALLSSGICDPTPDGLPMFIFHGPRHTVKEASSRLEGET